MESETGAWVMGRPGESKGATHQWLRIVVLVAGIALQLLVLYGTFVMGLMWAGWGYWTAVGQTVAALVVIVWLGRREPVLAVVVPFLSVLLTYGLWTVTTREWRNPRPCTPVEETILRELTPPDATLTDLQGDNDTCSAKVSSTRPADEVRTQFDQVFADHGWQEAPNDPYGRAAVREGLRVDIEASPDDDFFFIYLRPE